MLIPKEFIEELLERVNIVDVIGQRVNLKKKGSRYMACCPFHDEKTPSFTVNEEEKFYYCFGCHSGGSVINFIMRIEGVDYPAAIRQLAEQYDLIIPETGGAQSAKLKRIKYLGQILEDATKFYQRQLNRHPLALDYIKQRGISPEVVKDMSIGYAPGAWRTLFDHLQDRYSVQDLGDVGLIKSSSKKKNKYYDVFRNRLLFPIRNQFGHFIGFGGRTLDKNDSIKYLNSPETELFHKNREIYGLYRAQRKLGANRDQRLIIVEGYMDVVGCKSHGIDNVVACMGTAISRHQFQILFRKYHHLLLCMDGDRAGLDAAWRAAQESLAVLGNSYTIRFAFLPANQDPDSFLNERGLKKWESYIQDHTLQLDEFIFRRLSRSSDLSALSDQVRYSENVRRLVRSISNPLYKNLIVDSLFRKAGIAPEKLNRLIQAESNSETHASKPRAQTKRRPARSKYPTAWTHLIGLIVFQPQLIEHLQKKELLLEIDTRENGLLRLILHSRQHSNCATTARLLAAIEQTVAEQPQEQQAQTREEIKILFKAHQFYEHLVQLKSLDRPNHSGDDVNSDSPDRTMIAELHQLIEQNCNRYLAEKKNSQLKTRISGKSFDEIELELEEIKRRYLNSTS